MRMFNLKDMMISISDFKKQLSEIINKDMTKVIVKNNAPVSVIMPYEEYVVLNEKIDDKQRLLRGVAQDITLNNGVQLMVCVEHDGNVTQDGITVKTYVKMKTSGDYKLFFTNHLGAPNIEETLTKDELHNHYWGKQK